MIQIPKNIDLSNITYSAVKTQDSGAKSVYISLQDQPIYIQTPMLKTPFGMSKYPGDAKAEVDVDEKYSLQVSLTDATKSSVAFRKFLETLDAKIVEDGVVNCKQWFKKTYIKDVLAELYTPLVKVPKDKDTGEVTDKYPSTFKITVPVQNNKITVDVYDEVKKKIDIDLIPKQAHVSAILRMSGLWFAGSKFGCSFKLVQLRVRMPTHLNGFCFSDDEDDVQTMSEEGRIKPKYIESSDDEDDDAAAAAAAAADAPDADDEHVV